MPGRLHHPCVWRSLKGCPVHTILVYKDVSRTAIANRRREVEAAARPGWVVVERERALPLVPRVGAMPIASVSGMSGELGDMARVCVGTRRPGGRRSMVAVGRGAVSGREMRCARKRGPECVSLREGRVRALGPPPQ